MGTSVFWAWMLWFHLALVLVPGFIVGIKYEWEDLRKSRHPLPSTHQEVPEYQKAA